MLHSPGRGTLSTMNMEQQLHTGWAKVAPAGIVSPHRDCGGSQLLAPIRRKARPEIAISAEALYNLSRGRDLRDMNVPVTEKPAVRTRERPGWDSNPVPASSKTDAAISTATELLPIDALIDGFNKN
uniref:Uncharacterized protein n=1 Tax=Anopheles culicifacies TaxID=139723 RepID=A0A182MUI9_9DIPT